VALCEDFKVFVSQIFFGILAVLDLLPLLYCSVLAVVGWVTESTSVTLKSGAQTVPKPHFDSVQSGISQVLQHLKMPVVVSDSLC